jgi:hypothetical protein
VPSRGLQSLAFGVGLTALTAGALSWSGCTDAEPDDKTTSTEVEAAAADYGGPEVTDDGSQDTTDTGTTDTTDTGTTDTTDTGTTDTGTTG